MASLESNRISALAQKIYVITLILALSCSGCQFRYILHAASNQFRLIHNSVRVEDALKGDLIESEQKSRLMLVSAIKDFGEKELGLKKSKNYQTVYLKSNQPTIYIVSASPKDRLALISWWFPIVGDMPYLGFFDLKEAEKERERLVNDGLDVNIGLADAYSTLGWFKDPVTLNLLQRSTVELTEIILHEMTHNTLYLKGQGEFDEGLANLVGKVGVISFMRKTYGDTHPFTIEAENNLVDQRLFSSFLTSLLERLDTLYNSDITYEEKLVEREKIFTKSLKEFADIQLNFKADRFKGFGESGLNNAYLMSIGLYNRYFKLFEETMMEEGNSVENMLDHLRKIAGKGSDVLEGMKGLSSLHADSGQ
jgi:predicted aminopeptidase